MTMFRQPRDTAAVAATIVRRLKLSDDQYSNMRYLVSHLATPPPARSEMIRELTRQTNLADERQGWAYGTANKKLYYEYGHRDELTLRGLEIELEIAEGWAAW